jgi:hypothetical protein
MSPVPINEPTLVLDFEPPEPEPDVASAAFATELDIPPPVPDSVCLLFSGTFCP